MDDLGIQPPTAPGAQPTKEKKGLFSQFFKKQVQDDPVIEHPMESSRVEQEEFDIEDIRKKMGLETVDSTQDVATPPAIQEGQELPELPDTLRSQEPSQDLQEERIEEEVEVREDFTQPEKLSEGDAPEVAGLIAMEKEPEQEEAAEEEPQTDFAQDDTIEAEPQTDFASEPEHQEKPEENSQEVDWAEHEPAQEASEPETAPEHTLDRELEDLHAELDAQEAQTNFAQDTSEESTAQEETPLPATVDKAVAGTLQQLEKKHETIDAQLQKTIKSIHADTPEWATQKKEIHPKEYFTLKNGQKIRSFQELLGALSFIDNETFEHHVNDGRNDFSEWVHHVLAEEKLAERIRNKVAREDLLKILRSHETKMIKEFEKESKKFQTLTTKQKEKQKKITKLNEEIASLAQQVKKQSKELQALRGDAGKKVKQSVAKHVDAHHAKRTELLDEQYAKFEKLQEDVAKGQEELIAKEKAFHEESKDFIAEQKALAEEKSTFAQEKKKAELLLSQAKELRKMRAESEQDLSAIKNLLDKNKKATNELKKQEKATVAVLIKLEKDKKKMDAEVAKYSDMKADVDARDKVIAHNEKKSAQKIAKAEKASAQKISKQEKDTANKLKTAQKWYDQVKKDKEEFTALQKKEVAELKAKQKEVTALVKDLDNKTATYRELVEKHEKELTRNEAVLEETQSIRDEIQKRQEALSSDSMKEYLRTKSTDAVVTRLSNTSVPDVEEITNLHLYKLIDQCKDALSNSDVDSARKVYKQLRDEFGSTKLTSHEKSVLYNSIRELYDDIHLAMLNQ